MSAKHTPGPWVPDENGYYVRAEVYRGRKCLVDDGAIDLGTFPAICEVLGWPQHRWDFLNREEALANQRLIAAAPDMALLLRVLQSGAAMFDPHTAVFRFDGLRYSTRDGEWSRLADVIGRERLTAAIAKAEAQP